MKSRDYAASMTGGFLLDPEEEIELMNDYESVAEERKDAYLDYLDSEAWQRLRAKRLKMDGYKCTQCSETRGLQVHHLVYRQWHKTKLTDLTTLCARCHEAEHGR